MGTINAASAPIPGGNPTTAGTGASPYGSLSPSAIETLRNAGIPEDVIGVANGVVNGPTGTTGNGLPPVGTSGGTAPALPGAEPDQTYPSLTARHVVLLRMLGFPEANLQALAASNPAAAAVETQVQGMIASPAVVDQYLNLAAGTTAARVAQIPPALLTAPTGGSGTTNPGDQPDQTYPSLTATHVMVFRAIGTPENVIATIASGNPTAETVDQYIQQQVMQFPEQWDAYVGNPAGTARAGLQRLGLPVGNGTPVPGGTGPTPTPEQGKEDFFNTLIKGAVWGAVAIGVGFLAYKFFKGRGAKEAAQAVAGAAQGAQTLGMSAPRTLGMAAGAVGGGAGAGLLSAAEFNALRGLPPVRGDLAEILNASLVYGADMRSLLRWSVDIEAARTGGILARLVQGGEGIVQAASHVV